MTDWSDDPPSLGHGALGYRDAALPTDLLLRIASEGTLAPELRVVAARAALDAGERAAVTEIAETSALPHLREALERLVSKTSGTH